MITKYGHYSPTQIREIKLSVRKSIFFLLLYVDPETRQQYQDIDVERAFRNLQYRLNGLNSILLEPPELVDTMSFLEAALNEYMRYMSGEDFEFSKYRKLILDAGACIMKVKEGD